MVNLKEISRPAFWKSADAWIQSLLESAGLASSIG